MKPYYLDLHEAKSILEPRAPVFVDALRKAMHEWNHGLSHYHTTFDEFARGVLLSQMWYNYSSQALQGDFGVALTWRGSRPYYIFDQSVVLRFKHLNSAYQTWNYPTARALAWNAQSVFPSIPPLVKLDLGYRLDLTGTRVLEVMVMLNNNGISVWRWQIWGQPISEFAAAPKDGLGRTVFAYDNFAKE